MIERENELLAKARRLDDRSVELIQKSKAPGLQLRDIEQIIEELKNVNGELIAVNKELTELEKKREEERQKTELDEERLACQLKKCMEENIIIRSGDQVEVDQIAKKYSKNDKRQPHKKIRRAS